MTQIPRPITCVSNVESSNLKFLTNLFNQSILTNYVWTQTLRVCFTSPSNGET